MATCRSIPNSPGLVRVFLLSSRRFLRQTLSRILANQSGIAVVGARDCSPDTTVKIIESACDVLLVDPIDAGTLRNQFLTLRCACPALRVVLIDPQTSVAGVLRAIHLAAQTRGATLPEADRPGEAVGPQHVAT